MFSKSCKYAIRAVLYLALHVGTGKKSGVAEIAEALDVPKHFLAKILQQLARHNLVGSIKGPHGGFFLTEAHLKANLMDIVICIDGPESFSGCILGLPVCSSENPCPLHAQALAYREGLHYQLKYQTIEDLAKKIEIQELKI